jgi:hypothetical protein
LILSNVSAPTIEKAADLSDSKEAMERKYLELKHQLALADATRWRDMTVAFSVGAVSFLMIMIGVRIFSASRREHGQSHPLYRPMPGIDEALHEEWGSEVGLQSSRDLRLQGRHGCQGVPLASLEKCDINPQEADVVLTDDATLLLDTHFVLEGAVDQERNFRVSGVL